MIRNKIFQMLASRALTWLGALLIAHGYVKQSDQAQFIEIGTGMLLAAVDHFLAWRRARTAQAIVNHANDPAQSDAQFTSNVKNLVKLVMAALAFSLCFAATPARAAVTNDMPSAFWQGVLAITHFVEHNGDLGGGYFAHAAITSRGIRIVESGPAQTLSIQQPQPFNVWSTFDNRLGLTEANVTCATATRVILAGNWSIAVIPGQQARTSDSLLDFFRGKLAGGKIGLYAGSRVDKARLFLGVTGSFPIGAGS